MDQVRELFDHYSEEKKEQRTYKHVDRGTLLFLALWVLSDRFVSHAGVFALIEVNYIWNLELILSGLCTVAK